MMKERKPIERIPASELKLGVGPEYPGPSPKSRSMPRKDTGLKFAPATWNHTAILRALNGPNLKNVS